MSAPKKSAPAVTGAPKQAVPTPQVSAGPAASTVPPTRPSGKPYSVHRPSRGPLDAVRLFCLECMGSSLEFGREDAAVRDCPCGEMCSLYPYRFGKNPRHSRASARTVEKAGLRPSNRSGTRPNAAGGP